MSPQKYFFDVKGFCLCLSHCQDSEPSLNPPLDDCVTNFEWHTSAACPLNSSEHGDCKVTNPATGESDSHAACTIAHMTAESSSAYAVHVSSLFF